MAERKKITLSRGGSAERTVYINELEIPDLWHVAEALRKDRRYGPKTADAVLECWNIAHSFKKEMS